MLRSCHCPFKSVSLQSVNTTNTSFTRRLQWQSAQLEWTWVGRVCFVERETKWAWFLSIDASHTCVCVCAWSGQVRSVRLCACWSACPAPPRRAAHCSRHQRPAGSWCGRAAGRAWRAERPYEPCGRDAQFRSVHIELRGRSARWAVSQPAQ